MHQGAWWDNRFLGPRDQQYVPEGEDEVLDGSGGGMIVVEDVLVPHSRFWFSSLFSFFVAGSATELLGSMGRTKDRVSPFSQGSSNNALLKVIAQLRQQNEELFDRLASQQSVNGSVMAQARHTPATNSVASMVHPAADAAWKAKKTKSGPARDTSAKVIIQDGWSVPVVHSFEEFRLADTGICLATRSETEEAEALCEHVLALSAVGFPEK